MRDDRFKFKVRTFDDSFVCTVLARWVGPANAPQVLVTALQRHDGFEITERDAAEAAGLSLPVFRFQLRLAAIASQRAREDVPEACPCVTLARGSRRRPAPPTLEGRWEA